MAHPLGVNPLVLPDVHVLHFLLAQKMPLVMTRQTVLLEPNKLYATPVEPLASK